MAAPQLNITNKLLSAITNNKIHTLNKIDNDIFKEDSIAVQNKLSPILRQIAIKHLTNANTPNAKSFRGEYLPIDKIVYQQYLQEKSQNGTWGTEIEATAIGEALRLNIVVTSVYSDRSDTTWCLYLEDANAPTIHLYNYENLHWTNNNNTLTQTNGNCLFNAIAVSLKELENHVPYKSPLNSNSIFKYGSTERETIRKQILINLAIEVAIKNQQTPTEKEMAYLQEEKRIKQLPNEQKEQIAKDYTYALQLARENAQFKQPDTNNEQNTKQTALNI